MLCILQKVFTFAPLTPWVGYTRAARSCGHGVIGSHVRLRIWCREAWGFESLCPHEDEQRKLFVFFCVLMSERAHMEHKKAAAYGYSSFKQQMDSNFGGGWADVIAIYCSGLRPAPFIIRYRLYGFRRSSPFVFFLCGYSATIFTIHPKKLSNKAPLSLCLLSKCSFTISKLRFFELRKPKISSCYTTS